MGSVAVCPYYKVAVVYQGHNMDIIWFTVLRWLRPHRMLPIFCLLQILPANHITLIPVPKPVLISHYSNTDMLIKQWVYSKRQLKDWSQSALSPLQFPFRTLSIL